MELARTSTEPKFFLYSPSAPLEGVIMGRDKWLGGELGDDGCIYGVPGSCGQSRLEAFVFSSCKKSECVWF